MTRLTTLRTQRADDRGTTHLGWLQSRHSFSFGEYHDPERMNFRSLRVLNDDVVAPGAGFGEHPHRNMEILTWVLAGALKHRDSTGESGIITPGDLQVMSAGRGIQHSEMNASQTDPVRFLQIWIEPAKRNTEPAYRQRAFAPEGRLNRWQHLVAPGSTNDPSGPIPIGQDVSLRAADLEVGHGLRLNVADRRFTYLHIATGSVSVGGELTLLEGDAISFDAGVELSIEGTTNSQLLSFDLA